MEYQLSELIRADLERPRELAAKVAASITLAFGNPDPLELLTEGRLSTLPDPEILWLISAPYTPKPGDRIKYEEVIPIAGVSSETMARCMANLYQPSVQGWLTNGGEACRFALPEVISERYIRLLYLQLPISPEVGELVDNLATASEVPVARSLVRQKLWRNQSYTELLVVCLKAMQHHASFRVDKLRFLAEFVRSYHTIDAGQLTRALRNLIDSYQQPFERPVFNPLLMEYQAVAIPSPNCGPEVRGFRLAMASELLHDLG